MGQIVYDGLGNPVGIFPFFRATRPFARGALWQRQSWRWRGPQGWPPPPYTGIERDALQQEQPWQQRWPPLPYIGLGPRRLYRGPRWGWR
jgi:hypothetical protein